MLVDVLIILAGISAIWRGYYSGFVHQVCSAVGFIGGMFVGGWLQPHTVNLANTPTSRTFILIITTLGCALIGLTIGEYVGLRLKLKVLGGKNVNRLDNGFGSALAVVVMLISVWLLASIAVGLPYNSVRSDIKDSKIIGALNRLLPSAPDVIASMGHLIDPNGFPDVFIGSEPVPPSQVNLPSLGSLAAAVANDEPSVVRIRGDGCGGIVSGSGFVVGNDLVATNAHVVAGIARPYVQDSHGSFAAKVIWFDPNLDFAVLKVNRLNLGSLPLLDSTVSHGTPAAVLGYPGGGAFNAGAAAVLDEFNALGHNIYGQNQTSRDVYEIKAHVIPGNSGGPLINVKGQVIGVVFAESTTYNDVGYALTTTQVKGEIVQAQNHADQTVSTGSCAE